MRLPAAMINELFNIAMIGGNQALATCCIKGFPNAPQAMVYGFHGLDRSVKDAGVTDHIPVRVVADDQPIVPGLDGGHQGIRDLMGAHLRLEVIGCHPGRGNQFALFQGKFRLPPAGEEEGDMGIFFSFRKAQLAHAQVRDIFPQAVGNRLRAEGDGCVDVRCVFGQGHKGREAGQTAALEAVKAWLGEGPGQLACAVRPEIHEQDSIAIGNADAFAFDVNGGCPDEFIRLAAMVCGGQGRDGIFRGVFSLAIHQQTEGGLNPFPAVVPVHGEVATDY